MPKGRERLLGYLNDEITMTIIDRQPSRSFSREVVQSCLKNDFITKVEVTVVVTYSHKLLLSSPRSSLEALSG
jgi:hypothetical protein